MRCVKCGNEYDATAFNGCPACAKVDRIQEVGKGISAIGSFLIWTAVLILLVPCSLSACGILK